MSNRLQSQKQSFFQKQALKVIASERYALISAMLIALVPFLGWLAETILALVTLKKGHQAGARLLLPVILVHVLSMVFSVKLSMAILLASLNTVPVFVAAYILRQTASTRSVASILFLMIGVAALCLQTFWPEFAMQQYTHLEAVLQNLAATHTKILEFWQQQGISSITLAHYLLGVQGASFVLSALMPLFLARSLQSQLYYPGGFRQELLSFRGDKLSLLVLVGLMGLAYSKVLLAIDLLPLMLLFFMFAGLSFGGYVLASMHPIVLMAVLFLPLIFLSWVMAPFFVLVGMLDSLLNFRALLAAKANKAT